MMVLLGLLASFRYALPPGGGLLLLLLFPVLLLLQLLVPIEPESGHEQADGDEEEQRVGPGLLQLAPGAAGQAQQPVAVRGHLPPGHAPQEGLQLLGLVHLAVVPEPAAGVVQHEQLGQRAAHAELPHEGRPGHPVHPPVHKGLAQVPRPGPRAHAGQRARRHLQRAQEDGRALLVGRVHHPDGHGRAQLPQPPEVVLPQGRDQRGRVQPAPAAHGLRRQRLPRGEQSVGLPLLQLGQAGPVRRQAQPEQLRRVLHDREVHGQVLQALGRGRERVPLRRVLPGRPQRQHDAPVLPHPALQGVGGGQVGREQRGAVHLRGEARQGLLAPGAVVGLQLLGFSSPGEEQRGVAGDVELLRQVFLLRRVDLADLNCFA
mmetsp:Transcript_35280/g.51530  ORF Transcript_35280/g.51530 Transcript_35280/m.51530 type:complete len:374 (-) Transcript_35280:241-1362(-)